MGRGHVRCSDGMCGASDCERCHPGCHDGVTCARCGEEVAAHTVRDGVCESCEPLKFCEECGEAMPPERDAFKVCAQCADDLSVDDEVEADAAELDARDTE